MSKVHAEVTDALFFVLVGSLQELEDVVDGEGALETDLTEAEQAGKLEGSGGHRKVHDSHGFDLIDVHVISVYIVESEGKSISIEELNVSDVEVGKVDGNRSVLGL